MTQRVYNFSSGRAMLPETVLREAQGEIRGMRASIHNAMPIEVVRALVDFMPEFERRHG